MGTKGWLFLLAMALAAPRQLHAQGEVIDPLHGSPRPDTHRSLEKADNGLHETFLYDFLPQTLPVVDDFSIDRMRHLNAQSGDDDVTLTQTIYRLEVGGISTPDMVFMTDSTDHITYDIQPDTTIVTLVRNPVIVAIVRDVTQYPVPEQSMFVWPAYTVIDTVGDATSDTLHVEEPTLVQDSMLVYTVAAETGTYINPDNTPRPLILWADDDAYVNANFPEDPPTIGVATLDGMDRTGWPYRPDAPNMQGLADHLTSVPIELQFPPGDSIYLSFFCEPIGKSGDTQVHAADSLRLEFYAPDEDRWYLVWSREQAEPIAFDQVMVPVKDDRYLKSGFRMRFSNKATLGGAIDQWHIDYVRLGRNRTYTDTVLQDVAFVYPEASLLQSYTSVPYAKFINAPESYMAQSVTLTQKNLDTEDKFITWGYRSTEEGGATMSCNGPGSNIADNAQSTFTSVHPVLSGSCNYVYPTTATGADFYRNAFWTNATPDANAYNDSMIFVQELSNYYSYDDGSAEAGYSLTDGGAKQAMRFDTQGSDSLRAVRLYFDPIFTYNGVVNDPTEGSFLLTVWSSLDPENIVFQNVSFSSPQYNLWGPDKFVEYPLDSTIAVSGTFYVGWVQTNDTKMYLGLDRNRDNHDKMFYYINGQWYPTSYAGSWMIRPVMVAEEDPFVRVPEVATPSLLSLVPNPAGDAFRLRAEEAAGIAQVELLDALGRTVKQWRYDATPMSVQDVAPGLYIVRAAGRDGDTRAQGRLMVQR